MTTMTAPRPTETPTDELTERQREILETIFASARDKGYQPSYRDLMLKFHIRSPNGIQAHLHALRKKGWITLDPDSHSRSVRFLRRPDGHPFRGFVEREAEHETS